MEQYWRRVDLLFVLEGEGVMIFRSMRGEGGVLVQDCGWGGCSNDNGGLLLGVGGRGLLFGRGRRVLLSC